jgi:hypothetical protein
LPPTLIDRVSAANAEQLEKIFKRVLELARAKNSGADDADELSRFVLRILQMPLDTSISDRLQEQYERLQNVGGTVQTVMQLLNQHYEDMGEPDKLTPVWSALSLAVETLEDIANKIEPPTLLGREEVAHV